MQIHKNHSAIMFQWDSPTSKSVIHDLATGLPKNNDRLYHFVEIYTNENRKSYSSRALHHNKKIISNHKWFLNIWKSTLEF